MTVQGNFDLTMIASSEAAFPRFVRMASEPDVTDLPPRPRKRQRVRFADSMDAQVCLHFLSEERERIRLQDFWYSRMELREMKEAAKCESSLQRDPRLDCSLSMAFMNAKNGTAGVINSALDLIRNPLFSELRGLERWGSDCLALSRGTSILEAKTEVFLSQASLTTSTNDPYPHPEIEEGHHILAQRYAKANEPSQKFAQLMGLVDYVLAQD
jgi:hypothetical protein